MAPTVQKAVVIQQDGSVALREVAVPKPGPDEILVKVVAAAQNPADCGWRLLLLYTRLLFNSDILRSCQGRVHCTASALERSLAATSQGLSRRSGQMSHMVCAR
jgi:hypothetical protein